MRTQVLGYLVAVGATAVAVVVRLLLMPWLGEHPPMLLLVMALLVASWYGGLRPGLLATALCLLAGAHFFLEPIYSFEVATYSDRLRLALLLVIGVLVSTLSEIRLRAIHRLKAEIQHRQQAEAGERRQYEQLRVTLASIGDAVLTTDTRGRVTFLNPVAELLTGWSQRDAEGRPLEAVFNILHEQTRQPVESPVEKVLKTGTVFGLGNHSVLIARNGSERPIDDSAAPIHDADGLLLGVVLVFRDVTGQRQAERELHRSEQELADFFENATIGLHWTGPDGTILRANRAELELLGYDPEEYVGHHIAEFHADEEVIGDILKRLQARETLQDYPARLRCKDGSIKDVLIHSSVFVEDGQFVHTRCFTRDVTDRKRAEEALRQSEARFRGLMEQAPFSVQVFSPDGQTIRVNRAWEELWQVRFELMAAYNILEDRQLEAKGILPYIRQGFAGQATRIPAIMYNPNETIPGLSHDADPRRWLSAVIYPLKDAAGDIQEIVLIHEDITARQRAEDALRNSRERLELALQAADLGQWELTLDDHRATRNLRHDQIFGYDSLLPEWTYEMFLEHVAPEDRAEVDVRLQRAVASGGACEFEARILRTDGELRWIWVRGRAFQDLEGKPARMIGTVADVTDRKVLEEELNLRVGQLAEANRRQEELLAQLDTLQRNAPVGFGFVDRELRYVRINEALAAIDGYVPEHHLGRTVAEVVPKLWPKLEPLYRRVLESQQPVVNLEITGETPAAPGQARHWLVNYYPVRVREEVVGVGVLVADITERKRLEDELRRQAERLADADRRKDDFLAILAHELRNPLAPIRTGLELIKLVRDDVATIQEIRDTLERQTQQLITLVDDLLDVSRITRGKLALRRSRVQLSDVVRSAVEAAKPLLDEEGHRLSVTVPDQPLHLDADPHRLTQVLSNLLNNAARYTPPGGQVWLTAERHGSELVLSVKDNGIGIAADMLDRVFELFAQLERPPEKGHTTGLGIGLTLVKALVEMHGGRIEVRSDGPDRGSTFLVRLPILVELPEDVSPSTTPDEQATAGVKRRVLIVDDNEAAARMLGILVRALGHEVRTAGDGRQGIEMAASFLPDLVLLDIGMPIMNGFEAARRIRQQPWGENMMLVALTGWGQEEDRRRTREAGFDHHLVKPAESAQLQKLLAELNDRPT